ncbi:MAG TPA: M48 family metalloprotease [Vineibacter sp.]|nr:M48 family metalloprotease [Vineibacter sp.]
MNSVDLPWGQFARFVRVALTAVLAVALATACGAPDGPPAAPSTPVTAPAAPQSERPAGAEAARASALQRYGGAYVEGALPTYVERVGRRLVEANAIAGDWRFTILSSPVVNAFATDSGDVFVTRGLLAVLQDEAELAAAMGHEIGHVLARHAALRRAQEARIYQTAADVARSTRDPQLALAFAQIELAQARAFSREQEFEADRIAIRLLAKAGYDTAAVPRSLQRLQEYNVLQARTLGLAPDAFERQSPFATHPRTLARAEAARAEAGAGGGRREVGAYLDAVDGMLFGDPPHEGFARGRRFLHPQLGFAFEAPSGYTLLNNPRTVQAYGPDNAYLVFACSSRPPDGGMVDAMRRLFPSSPLTDARTLTINGLEAATGITQRSSDSGDIDSRVVAIRYPPGVCAFVLVSRALGPPARAQELFQAAQTFRRLSPAELSRARPLRLRVVAVRAGDTPERLTARGPADENFRVERFLLLNGLRPGERLDSGQRVKTVVAE